MIASISKPRRSNIGGLQSVQVVPVSEVSEITPVVNGKTTCTLVSGKAWRTLYTTPGSRKYEDTPASAGRRQYREVLVSGRIPATEETTLEQLKAYSAEGFVVKTKDNNGKQRLIGSPDEPMFFSYSDGSGSAPEEYNGSEFTFARSLRESPPFID
jgi:hypothetical protein